MLPLQSIEKTTITRDECRDVLLASAEFFRHAMCSLNDSRVLCLSACNSGSLLKNALPKLISKTKLHYFIDIE